VTKRALWLLLLLALLGAVMTIASASSAVGATGQRVDVGTMHASEAVERGILPLAATVLPSTRASSGFGTLGRTASTASAAAIGDEKYFLVLNDVTDQYGFALFTLRGVGDHIEIWVQNNLNFPADDCRNDGVRNVVTTGQVNTFIHEFDTNIYPKESAAFSVPPDRDGSDAQLPGLLGQPNALGITPDYYEGAGAKIVTLVSNVRDTNYFTPPNVSPSSYIAGFFSSQLNGYFGRNVMTIDSYDWVHRTGENPPDNPVPGDLCKSAPARPFLYEGVFAHEYQHLLESYEDGDEVNWINEGLSDWAQTLVGYVNPATPITQRGFDSHVQCFTGFLEVATPVNVNPSTTCGPENSLTRWQDQGPDEILADYGAAYTMMELLAGRYGTGFMSSLHRGEANGFAGVDEALAATGQRKANALAIFDDWTLAVALDGLIDDGYKTLGSAKEKSFTVPTLHSTIYWATPNAYSSPGAPPNGSDYVQLRNGSTMLTGAQIDSIAFKGATSLAPAPLAWSVVASPPGQTGDAALYSGTGNNRDEAAVTPITVPSGSPSLTFNALWDLETGWDFGFVQVSTDGGATYTSISCTDTTSTHDPDAVAEVVDKLPGFTGVSGGTGTWRPQTCSLAAYAGQSVQLAFRVVNDPAVQGNGSLAQPGLYVDDIAVNGTVISDGSSLTPFKSISQTRPTAVSNFTVTLLSIDSKSRKITVKQIPLTGEFAVSGNANVQKYIDKKADFVGAVVTYNDPSESSTQYASYQLTVNGVVQPGGA
jgi:Immune inhibitor A peptidase M6